MDGCSLCALDEIFHAFLFFFSFHFCQRKKYWKGMIGIFLITHGNATMAEAQISIALG
jgi:hypothetical protein